MAGGSLGPTELILPTHTSDPTGSEGSMYLRTDTKNVRIKTSDGWKDVYEDLDQYVTNGLQLFFDANRTSSWTSGTNPYDLISGTQASLTNVSNTITTDSPNGAKAMYFNDTGNCRWSGGVLGYPRTYEVWVCSKDWNGTNWQTFTDDNSTESILFGAPQNETYVYTSTQSGTSTTLQNNTWYNIAYTCDSISNGSGTIYVNGSATQTFSSLSRTQPSVGSTLYMGGDSGQGESMKGWIAILRTYNRILSSSEITQNWNNDKVKFGY